MRYRLLLGLWILSDLLLFLGAYALAYFLRVGWIFSTDFPFEPFITVVLLIAPVWIVMLLSIRVFRVTTNQRSLRTGASIIYISIVGISLFALTYYFLVGFFFSRLLLVTAFLFSSIGTWIWHMVFENVQRAILRKDPPEFPTLIIGVTRESSKLIHKLNRRKNPLKPVAILDGRGTSEKEIDGVPILGKLNKLEETLESQHITHLIQCSDLEQSLNLLSACRTRDITYMLLPSVMGIVERDERISDLEGYPVTVVKPTNPKKFQ